ncbi:MAG: HAD-IA family hydrolase, partial [Burkholderiales bacterium]|nr:HAD-IA family hydrolase [Burkholderiales bacterium]
LKSDDYPRVIERYRHHYFAGEEAVVLFDGVRPGLESLMARGHLLAVATGKSRRGLDQILETTGLGPLFHGTRCGDEGFPKPHPEMLEILLDTFGVGRDAALMIGDTTHDLEMAKAAGVDGLAVTYGAHDAAKLAAAAPLASVHTPAELWQWLERNG